MADLNQPEGARYANLDEFRSEFGDYRVNKDYEPLSDATKPEPIVDEMVDNDPYTCQFLGKKEDQAQVDSAQADY